MINAKELKAVITTAKKYCRKGNTTIPALNKVLVSLSRNRLTIRSTDLTTWYQRTIDIDNVALKDLRFIVDASHLLKILNSIKESININVIDNVLHIYTDTLELASVDVSDAENYPEPIIDDMSSMSFLTTLKGGTIKQLAQLAIGRYHSDLHPLGGICCNPIDKCLYTTNGNVMYRYERMLPLCEENVVINATRLSHLSNDDYNIYYNDKQVLLSSLKSQETILTENIKGIYPDCKRIIPHENIKAFSIDSKILNNAINSIKHSINARCDIIVLTLNSGILTLSNADNNTRVNIPVDNTLNIDIRIGFNYKYLLQLANLGNLTFKVNQDVKYRHVACVMIDTDDFDVLLMPIKLD